jgi:catechol 2,3-dioxygenase-like lactoylglutathione lyase family enzyme
MDMLSKPYTAIFVKDIEASKHFYCNYLGESINLDFGANVILQSGLTLWQISAGHIIPKTLGLEKTTDRTVNRFELYYETEGLDQIFRKLRDAKIRFVHEIHEEPWGQRTIRFFDPDNHLIEIGESMKQFVTRFYSQGMTVEQVSARTSVPVEEVKKLTGEQ